MNGYRILGRRSTHAREDRTFGIYGIDGKDHGQGIPLSWWLAGTAIIVGGLWALSARAHSPATLRRRALIAGLAAAPGCRSELLPERVNISAPSPYYGPDLRSPVDFGVVPDLETAADMATPPDLVVVGDLAASRDLARTVDLVKSFPDFAGCTLAVCCDSDRSNGCYAYDSTLGRYVPYDPGDAGEKICP